MRRTVGPYVVLIVIVFLYIMFLFWCPTQLCLNLDKRLALNYHIRIAKLALNVRLRLPTLFTNNKHSKLKLSRIRYYKSLCELMISKHVVRHMFLILSKSNNSKILLVGKLWMLHISYPILYSIYNSHRKLWRENFCWILQEYSKFSSNSS